MALQEVIAIVQQIMLVLSCLVFFVIVLTLFDLYRKRHILKFSKDLQCFKFYPIIGNANIIGKDIFTVIEDVKKEHGLPGVFWNGHFCHYVTSDVSEVKIILNHPKSFNKGRLYDGTEMMFKNTLLLADYDEWRKNRKLFSRCFSQPILNNFVNRFYEKSCILVEMLKNSDSKDIYDIFGRFSLDNFCVNVMGIDIDAQINLNKNLPELLNRIQSVLSPRVFTNYFIPMPIYIFSSIGREGWKDYFQIMSTLSQIIEKKRTMFEEESNFRENNNKLPLMDFMLEAEKDKVFTNNEITKEINLFILAATDTSANTLAFVFTLLGMNPEAQEKLYKEVIETVGLDGPICHSDLPNLKYTERVIYESQRLLPVTPALERHADADIDLGTHTIPAGTGMTISTFNLHRSEKLWKNPLEFNPDRFLPKEVAERDPYAFIPFSAGPRNCIGMKYALMLMKTCVAHVTRNYMFKSNYKSVEDMRLTSYITMKTIDKLDCSFIPRDHLYLNNKL